MTENSFQGDVRCQWGFLMGHNFWKILQWLTRKTRCGNHVLSALNYKCCNKVAPRSFRNENKIKRSTIPTTKTKHNTFLNKPHDFSPIKTYVHVNSTVSYTNSVGVTARVCSNKTIIKLTSTYFPTSVDLCVPCPPVLFHACPPSAIPSRLVTWQELNPTGVYL